MILTETTFMRILHTSHTGLQDPRVERTAMTMKKEGHEMIFLGAGKIKGQGLGSFEETHYIPIPSTFRVAVDPRFKKKWLKTIDAIKPDVVHAHNLIAGAMMLDTEYPVIYDDHENWGRQLFKFYVRGFIRNIFSQPMVMVTPKWERKVLTKYPVITVSEENLRDHKRYAKHVSITRNYPYLFEIESLPNPIDRKGNVYVGYDFNHRRFLPHRNMTGLRDIINLDVICGLPHKEVMRNLLNYKIGLVPWIPHIYQKYMDPNKIFEYLHTGLPAVTNSIVKRCISDDPYVYSFEDYSEIKQVIDGIGDPDSGKIMDHARANYIWDKQEDIIKSMYKLV